MAVSLGWARRAEDAARDEAAMERVNATAARAETASLAGSLDNLRIELALVRATATAAAATATSTASAATMEEARLRSSLEDKEEKLAAAVTAAAVASDGIAASTAESARLREQIAAERHVADPARLVEQLRDDLALCNGVVATRDEANPKPETLNHTNPQSLKPKAFLNPKSHNP